MVQCCIGVFYIMQYTFDLIIIITNRQSQEKLLINLWRLHKKALILKPILRLDKAAGGEFFFYARIKYPRKDGAKISKK